MKLYNQYKSDKRVVEGFGKFMRNLTGKTAERDKELHDIINKYQVHLSSINNIYGKDSLIINQEDLMTDFTNTISTEMKRDPNLALFSPLIDFSSLEKPEYRTNFNKVLELNDDEYRKLINSINLFMNRMEIDKLIKNTIDSFLGKKYIEIQKSADVIKNEIDSGRTYVKNSFLSQSGMTSGNFDKERENNNKSSYVRKLLYGNSLDLEFLLYKKDENLKVKDIPQAIIIKDEIQKIYNIRQKIKTEIDEISVIIDNFSSTDESIWNRHKLNAKDQKDKLNKDFDLISTEISTLCDKTKKFFDENDDKIAYDLTDFHPERFLVETIENHNDIVYFGSVVTDYDNIEKITEYINTKKPHGYAVYTAPKVKDGFQYALLRTSMCLQGRSQSSSEIKDFIVPEIYNCREGKPSPEAEYLKRGFFPTVYKIKLKPGTKFQKQEDLDITEEESKWLKKRGLAGKNSVIDANGGKTVEISIVDPNAILSIEKISEEQIIKDMDLNPTDKNEYMKLKDLRDKLS